MSIRHDWTLEELQNLYALSLIELISRAHAIHIQHHEPAEVQVCSLISIKTGGCPEDCAYCAQSARYQTTISAQPMMPLEEVLVRAQKAIAGGATRICLGAAWREVRDGLAFEKILEMIQKITSLGAEVCCTLGMLQEHHAKRLKEAGLYAYNHNLDSSEKFYKTIITTRSYHDRLNTLSLIENADISVCCGGILGMGEEPIDRLELLQTLANRTRHPDSVPINRLSAVPGTPLENKQKLSTWEMIRVIAIARIMLPKTIIRLSAGRIDMSYEEHALCFLAGANSIHAGEKLLTVANTSCKSDEAMFSILGIKKMATCS